MSKSSHISVAAVCDIPVDMEMAGAQGPGHEFLRTHNYLAMTSTFTVATTPSKSVACTLAVPTSFTCSSMWIA